MIPQSVLDVLAGRSRYALVCGDGFALAAEMGDGAVGIVLGDLPYDERTHNGAFSFNARRKKAMPVCGTGINFAHLPPVPSFLPSLMSCSPRWVVVFCALEQLGEYKQAAGDGWVRSGVWARTTGTPQLSGDRPAQGAEGIAIMHRPGKMRWNGGGKRAVWNGGRCQDPTRKHPTKKPLWLMEALLRDFAEPGDIVFDPTMGEATTGEACYRLGLPFIGCEIDPEKYQWAVDRMRRAEAAGVQMTLPQRQTRAKQEVLFR